MNDYYDIYNRRLNRYGENYQARIQAKREEEFENYLLKTVYRVDFIYRDEDTEDPHDYCEDDHYEVGSLERYKQDETKTLQYFLTRVRVNLKPGTILKLPDKDGKEQVWMVYWLEDIKASGYNRYVLLKMDHILKWKARDGSEQEAYAHFYGQEDNMLKDELKSRSRMDTLYTENLKMSFYITPFNNYIRRDDYMTVTTGELKEGYRVTGYDILSTEGVEYVTVDPVYLFDESDPVDTTDVPQDESFWLTGGK